MPTARITKIMTITLRNNNKRNDNIKNDHGKQNNNNIDHSKHINDEHNDQNDQKILQQQLHSKKTNNN